MGKIKSDLKMVINLIDWTHIVERFWRITSKQSKGLKKLKVTNFQSLWIRNDNMTLRKLHIISPFINYLILKSSYYVKFWIFTKRLKFENYLLPFELLYWDVYDSDKKDESLLQLKSKKKDVGLSSYRIYNKKDHRFENLSQKEYDAFINLSDNKNTIIQKTDKGNTVVIIDWENYVKEIEEILSYTNKFLKVTEVTFNPKRKVNKEIRHLLDVESSIKNCLNSLLDNTYLPKEDYKFLKLVGGRPGIMYGLCKVHKYNLSTNKIPPFRLILSAIGNSTYNLAKFFVPILK